MRRLLARIFEADILVRAAREGSDWFHDTKFRKKRERKAIAWKWFQQRGIPDQWPMNKEAELNEVKDEDREEFLATFGPEGVQQVIEEFKAYLLQQGMMGIYIDTIWEEPDE